MLLTIDAGNTSISFGVFNKDKLIKKFSLTSDKKRSVDEYGVLISAIIKQNGIEKSELKACIMASVVPTLTDILKEAIKNYINIDVIKVTTKINTGITYKLDNPRELGADRIANAKAAIDIAKGIVEFQV